MFNRLKKLFEEPDCYLMIDGKIEFSGKPKEVISEANRRLTEFKLSIAEDLKQQIHREKTDAYLKKEKLEAKKAKIKELMSQLNDLLS